MSMMKEQTAEKKSYPPIYEHSVHYAKEHGELKAFNESYTLNDRCKWAIQDMIEESAGGRQLNGDAVKAVIEEYGAERTGMILAGSIRYAEWGTENFSEDNSRWAGEYPIPKDIGWKMHDGYLTVNTSPAALDGYVDLFRQEMQEQEKKAPDRTAPGKTAKVKPKAVEKVSVLARLKENAPRPKQAEDRAQDKDRNRQRGDAR